MHGISKLVCATIGGALAFAWLATDADAHRRGHRWSTIGTCYPAIEGAATSTGILGQGSAKARIAAQSNWEMNAEDKYGPEFANFAYARDVQWDCKKGAILLAKCVIVAKPCGARISG